MCNIMNFRPNITPIEVVKKERLEGLISEIFILVLIVNCIESYRKTLMS